MMRKNPPGPLSAFLAEGALSSGGAGALTLCPFKLGKMCRVEFDLTFNQPPKEIIRSLSSTETISWNNPWHF